MMFTKLTVLVLVLLVLVVSASKNKRTRRSEHSPAGAAVADGSTAAGGDDDDGGDEEHEILPVEKIIKTYCKTGQVVVFPEDLRGGSGKKGGGKKGGGKKGEGEGGGGGDDDDGDDAGDDDDDYRNLGRIPIGDDDDDDDDDDSGERKKGGGKKGGGGGKKKGSGGKEGGGGSGKKGGEGGGSDCKCRALLWADEAVEEYIDIPGNSTVNGALDYGQYGYQVKLYDVCDRDFSKPIGLEQLEFVGTKTYAPMDDEDDEDNFDWVYRGVWSIDDPKVSKTPFSISWYGPVNDVLGETYVIDGGTKGVDVGRQFYLGGDNVTAYWLTYACKDHIDSCGLPDGSLEKLCPDCLEDIY